MSGPLGCGKSALVYALAHEFNLSVLEVNSSQDRSGHAIRVQLAEATQSQRCTLPLIAAGAVTAGDSTHSSFTLGFSSGSFTSAAAGANSSSRSSTAGKRAFAASFRLDSDDDSNDNESADRSMLVKRSRHSQSHSHSKRRSLPQPKRSSRSRRILASDDEDVDGGDSDVEEITPPPSAETQARRSNPKSNNPAARSSRNMTGRPSETTRSSVNSIDRFFSAPSKANATSSKASEAADANSARKTAPLNGNGKTPSCAKPAERKKPEQHTDTPTSAKRSCSPASTSTSSSLLNYFALSSPSSSSSSRSAHAAAGDSTTKSKSKKNAKSTPEPKPTPSRPNRSTQNAAGNKRSNTLSPLVCFPAACRELIPEASCSSCAAPPVDIDLRKTQVVSCAQSSTSAAGTSTPPPPAQPLDAEVDVDAVDPSARHLAAEPEAEADPESPASLIRVHALLSAPTASTGSTGSSQQSCSSPLALHSHSQPLPQPPLLLPPFMSGRSRSGLASTPTTGSLILFEDVCSCNFESIFCCIEEHVVLFPGFFDHIGGIPAYGGPGILGSCAATGYRRATSHLYLLSRDASRGAALPRRLRAST